MLLLATCEYALLFSANTLSVNIPRGVPFSSYKCKLQTV